MVRDTNLRVIFDQWPNLHLGLDALSTKKILKGVYFSGCLLLLSLKPFQYCFYPKCLYIYQILSEIEISENISWYRIGLGIQMCDPQNGFNPIMENMQLLSYSAAHWDTFPATSQWHLLLNFVQKLLYLFV